MDLKIWLPKSVPVDPGDELVFRGDTYKVTSVSERRIRTAATPRPDYEIEISLKKIS